LAVDHDRGRRGGAVGVLLALPRDHQRLVGAGDLDPAAHDEEDDQRDDEEGDEGHGDDADDPVAEECVHAESFGYSGWVSSVFHALESFGTGDDAELQLPPSQTLLSRRLSYWFTEAWTTRSH